MKSWFEQDRGVLLLSECLRGVGGEECYLRVLKEKAQSRFCLGRG